MIKTALIAGGPLWERVRDPRATVDAGLVLACARTKLAVVESDERDAGRRQVLNLGHTVGHAIETATGYARYRHGEAVSLGLLAALTLSGKPGLRAEVASLLAAHGLPTTLDPAVDHGAVLAAAAGRQEAARGPRRIRARRRARRRAHRPGRRARRARAGAGGAGMNNRVAVMHGVNLGALDRRPAEHYGGLTFAKLEFEIEQFARELELDARFFQSDHEGAFIEELHNAPDYADGLLLNPGAWTHYAWSLRDAVELAGLPAVEVHLSDVKHREPFRAVSVLEDVCVATVSGQGVDGYRVGLERLKAAL